MSNSKEPRECPDCGRIHGAATGHMTAEIERAVAFLLNTQHDELLSMSTPQLMKGIVQEFLSELGRMNTVMLKLQERCRACEIGPLGRKIECAHCTAEELMLSGITKNLTVTIAMAEAWMIAQGLIKPH